LPHFVRNDSSCASFGRVAIARKDSVGTHYTEQICVQ